MTAVQEHVITPAAPVPPMRPARYRVAGRIQETYDTVTLLLRPVDDPIQVPRPGQFTMLYVFGVGEVPVSVSGIGKAPDQVLAQTIRAVGAVTHALCAAKPGDMIGVRGPFGTDWGVSGADGRDMLIVAGGIGLAPLRPVVLAALAERGRGQVVLLAGARSPGDLVFAHELDVWRRRGADVRVTVDHGDAGWDGRVGLVTGLIQDAIADPAATTAFVCGPEIMMRLSAQALVDADIAARDIRVSLERNMRCGVALCGHCQLGPLLVCRDGPVVSYAEAAALLAKREL
jgi:anaerobic sulfite reductase subunit B